jgi:hypothetical protein
VPHQVRRAALPALGRLTMLPGRPGFGRESLVNGTP